MVFLPSTSDFPPDPEPLSREDLNSVYRELRSCYASSLRSRGQHRRLANKARDEATLLKQRLVALANSDLPSRKEYYEILEIATSIVNDFEDAGDDLVNGYSSYKKGRHSFQGGGYLGDLMRAVIHFISRWGRTKDRLSVLKQKQQELINKSQDLLPPPPPPGGNGNGHGPGTTTLPANGTQLCIDVSTNGIQPPQLVEPTGPQQPLLNQPNPESQPQSQDQAKGAPGHG